MNNFIHRLKARNLLKNNKFTDRVISYKAYDEIKTCLVFAKATSSGLNAVHILEDKFKGPVIHKIFFGESSKKIKESPSAILLGYRNLNFHGEISHPRLSSMLQNKYDLIIDFTAQDDALIRYMLYNLKASFIISPSRESSLADMIVPAHDSKDFVEKIIKILTRLKKN